MSHPDFILTPDQRTTYRALRDRIDKAMALHAGKAWRVSRIKRLRAGLARHAATNDRRYFAQFLGEYRAAIDLECRFLEDSAPTADEALARVVVAPDNCREAA